MKVCKICNIEKDNNCFNKSNSCKKCEYVLYKDTRKRYQEANKEKITEYNKEYNNRDEIKEHKREYHREYNKKRKEYFEKYFKKNKSDIINKRREYQKKYRKDNKDSLQISYNEYRKNRKTHDPIYRLSEKIRSTISLIFKTYGYKKSSRTEKIIGCSFDEFKIHLESKFEPWMNWNNYGLYNGNLNYGWDIDHIIPISSVKSEDDIIELSNYKNLQPLCSYINRYIKRNEIYV